MTSAAAHVVGDHRQLTLPNSQRRMHRDKQSRTEEYIQSAREADDIAGNNSRGKNAAGPPEVNTRRISRLYVGRHSRR